MASPGRSYFTDSPFVEKNGLRLPDGCPSRFAGREPVNNFRQRFAGRLNHLCGEALHLFQLRTELQQKQIRAGIFKLTDAFTDLLRSADEAGAQSAVGN